MNKFEKKNFKNGMIVKCTNDKEVKDYIIFNEMLLNCDHSIPLSDFDENLKIKKGASSFGTPYDEKIKIIEIYENNQLIWKREEPKKFGRQRVGKGEKYYYISDCGLVLEDIEDDSATANSRFEFGNYYRTVEEAEKAQKKQLAIMKVNDAIDKLNHGWVPDWEDNDQEKPYICYSYLYDCLISDDVFYSKNDKKTNYIKNKEIAEQIIEDYKEELKLIFDVEERQ